MTAKGDLYMSAASFARLAAAGVLLVSAQSGLAMPVATYLFNGSLNAQESGVAALTAYVSVVLTSTMM